MRTFTRIYAAVLLMAGILMVSLHVFAFEYQNYQTFPVSEEQSDFLEQIDFQTTKVEPDGNSFSRFAVSAQGQIALASQTGKHANVSIYGSTGEFLYCLRFMNNGSAYAIFYEGEILSICWGKELLIGSFDVDGNCIQLREYRNSNRNSDAYHRDRYRPATGEAGDLKYAARGIRLSSEYTRFEIEDRDGNCIVVFDRTEEKRTECLIGFVAVLPIAAGTILAIYGNRKKR